MSVPKAHFGTLMLALLATSGAFVGHSWGSGGTRMRRKDNERGRTSAKATPQSDHQRPSRSEVGRVSLHAPPVVTRQ